MNQIPYTEAEPKVDRSKPPFQTDKTELAGIVLKIVEVEGPVHIDCVVSRVRILWGLDRAGKYTLWTVRRAPSTRLMTLDDQARLIVLPDKGFSQLTFSGQSILRLCGR